MTQLNQLKNDDNILAKVVEMRLKNFSTKEKYRVFAGTVAPMYCIRKLDAMIVQGLTCEVIRNLIRQDIESRMERLQVMIGLALAEPNSIQGVPYDDLKIEYNLLFEELRTLLDLESE